MSWAEQRSRLLAPKPKPVVLACLISGCLENAADLLYCADHRRMADDGTLWLRCVFCSRPVAPHDPIACLEHRTVLDAETATRPPRLAARGGEEG